MIVIGMITEFEGCDPVDQGVQALCTDRDASERWVKENWPFAKFHPESEVWEIITEDGESLDTFLTIQDMEVYS